MDGPYVSAHTSHWYKYKLSRYTYMIDTVEFIICIIHFITFLYVLFDVHVFFWYYFLYIVITIMFVLVNATMCNYMR